jgi:hypothetical protein
MRIKYLAFLIIPIISACNDVDKAQVETRPRTELAFIDQFIKAGSLYSVSDNEVVKKEALDSGMIKISNFIRDSLNYSFENWPARVKSIEVSEFPVKSIDVVFFIPKKKYFELGDTTETYDAIHFQTFLKYDDTKTRNSLKDIKLFDKVLISGTFVKNTINKIEFSSNPENEEYRFNNPLFDVRVNKIEKQ